MSVMKTNSAELLDLAITDYLLWMIDAGYSKSTWNFYERVLHRFQKYTCNQGISWDDVFTSDSLLGFGRFCKLVQFQSPIRGLTRYLYKQQRISKSMDKRKEVVLSDRYRQYLIYYEKTRQVCRRQILNSERVLVLFAEWLTGKELKLQDLRIEHLDTFQAEVSNRYAPETRKRHRSVLRGFLGWLYQQKQILRNLSPLLVGAPQYAKAIPPKFLRPEELRKLFAIQPQTASDNRTRAMLYLACSLGLRPKEISLISLDDINFARQEILLPQRKSANPITIPLPLAAIKAVADYIIRTRPETDRRSLFLQLHAPYEPVRSLQVSLSINSWMHRAGIQGSAYWLRHTYAQNLLESGASIFAIRDMMGHDNIQTTNRYIQIHPQMMRKVLFNEKL